MSMSKFDDKLRKIIYDNEDKEIIEKSNLLNVYFDSFIKLREIFFNDIFLLGNVFLNKQCLDIKKVCKKNSDNELCVYENDVYKYISLISSRLLNTAKKIACYALKKTYCDISYECWNLYIKKNKEYGDAWAMNGIFGIFYDLHRKSVRLYEMATYCKNNRGRLCDKYEITNTIIDIINYCSMFILAINSNEIFLFDTIHEKKLERIDFSNVEL